MKFEAIFRKSCRGLFEEKCVFWVTDFGTSHFFLRHPVNFSRSNNYSGVAWIKKSIFTTPNVKTDNITLWATSRPKNWCGLIWCYGLLKRIFWFMQQALIFSTCWFSEFFFYISLKIPITNITVHISPYMEMYSFSTRSSGSCWKKKYQHFYAQKMQNAKRS